jgi:Zn-dependent membrane protease YugP
MIMDRGGWHYPPGDFRVSDADRDQALSELSAAFQAGRITADEFDQRSGQTLRSRTGKELTALLADLPVERVPATRTSTIDPARRAVAARVAAVAAVAAFCFATTAAVAALGTGPTLQQKEAAEAIAIRQGLAPPVFPPSSAFNWAGTLTPAAIAVLLIMLAVFLHLRLARADRRH